MKIVVVEDEYRIRQGLCQLIPKLSPEFQLAGSAENGYEGMYLIKELQPDVAVCDVEMKVMNGLSMIRQLKDLNISCAYLILSGYSEFEYAREAISLGVAGYLLKSVIPGELKEALLKIREKLETEPGTPREEQEPQHLLSCGESPGRDSGTLSAGSFSEPGGGCPADFPGVSEHGFRQRDRRKFCVLSKAVQD